MRLLQDALPRRGAGLVQFNDHECRDIDELRSVIARARALVNEDAERERAGEAVRRWLLAEIEKERNARAAAGDYRETYVLCPRVPGDAPGEPARLAA
jgi:hypothetical protein